MIEDRDTILELTARIQELQIAVNCMNDSRDFKDAESVRSGLSHVPSQPVSFPPHPIPGGMLSSPGGMLSSPGSRQIFGIRMVFRETFLKIHRCLLHHLIHKGSIRGFPAYQNTHHRM